MIPLSLLKKSTEKIYARSSGPGGQHVNKTSTKVQLTFDILESGLSEVQKNRLLRKYTNGFIRVMNQGTRSQPQNTRLAFEQLRQLIADSLKVKRRRIKKKAPHLTKTGKKKKMRKDKLLKYKRRYENS